MGQILPSDITATKEETFRQLKMMRAAVDCHFLRTWVQPKERDISSGKEVLLTNKNNKKNGK